jgi:hypothetical protein
MPSSPNSPRNSPQEGDKRAAPYGDGYLTYLNGKWYSDAQVNYFNAQNQQQQDQSYGGGGGGSYYQAPEPQVDPTTTPAYLAYMNALTAEGDMIGTNDREQRTQAAMRYGTNKSNIAEFDPNAAEDWKGSELTSLDNRYDASGGINDRTRASFESRGALNSGAYANRVTQNREQRESATAAITKALQDALANIGTQSAAKRADIERRKAGAALGMID